MGLIEIKKNGNFGIIIIIKKHIFFRNFMQINLNFLNFSFEEVN